MGNLEYLEVENFKSYKGIQKIGPFYRFTAVIGPNGSGKSNLMDALSFVLGLKSKHLRSSNVKELIYRGLQHLNDAENKPTSAYVKMVYIKDDGTKLVLKRTVNHNGTSDYYIDNRKTNYNNFNTRLMDENILVEARNFLVFQGDVESVASQSGKELCNLIEQISGSLKYKEEYDNLKLILERKVEASTFNFTKKKGMNLELKQFEMEREEAEQYQRLKQELEDLNLKLMLIKLFQIEDNFQKVEIELEQEDRKIIEVSKQMEIDTEKVRKARVGLSRTQLDLKKIQMSITELEHTMENQQPQLVTAQTQLTHATTKLRNLQGSYSKVNDESQMQQYKVNQVTTQLHTARQALHQHETSFTAMQAQDLSTNDLIEYETIKSEFLKDTSQISQQLDTLERPEQLTKDQITEIELIIQQLIHRLDRLNQVQKELTARQSNFQVESTNLTKLQEETQVELESTISTRTMLEHQEKEANEQLTRILNQLVQIKIDATTNLREVKLKEGIATLQRIYPCVYGRLGDLIRPSQSKYETAVLTVMGVNLDAIVVQDGATATECIKFLKEQRLGTVKFLPLDSLQVSPVKESIRDTVGIKLALDLIHADSKFDKAICYACGNSIIVDSYGQGKQLAYAGNLGVKIVTLEGTVFHTSGLIEGGGAKVATAAKVVKRWEEKQVEEFKLQRDQLLIKLNTIQKNKRSGNLEQDLQRKLVGFEDGITFTQEELSKSKRQLNSNRQEIDMISDEFSNRTNQLNQLKQQLHNAQLESNKLRNQLNSEQDRMYAAFCKRLHLKNIRDYEKLKLQTTQQAFEQQAKFRSSVSKLENQLTFESQRYQETATRLTQLQNNLTKQQTQLDQYQSELSQLRQRLTQNQQKLDAVNQSLQAKQTVKDKATVDHAQLNHARDLTQNTLSQLQKSITANETLLTMWDSQRTQLFRACLRQQIPLSLLTGSLREFDDLQTNPIDNKNSEHRYLGVDRRIQSSDWHTQVDYELLSEVDKTDGKQIIAQLELEMEQTELNLDKLVPNLKVLDKVDAINKRKEETDREFDEARNEAVQAKDRFNSIKLSRYQAFYTAFTQISQSIDHIYKSLTKSSTAPTGGTAYLSLEDSDEPYLAGIRYHATPPLKRFRDMELLSGGEKSVAALALLLAIHQVRPAPFLVLDEVDAALDNSNVNRTAHFLVNILVVISLKQRLYEKADTLVGICRDLQKNSSACLTLDLEKYKE